MKIRKPPVATVAVDLGIPLEQPSRVRDEAFLERMRSIAPDIGVVVAYGRILPQTLLEIPRHGFINVHASLLPRYRGAAPIQRAIENGERETGVTIMRVDRELDHGPMILTSVTPIGPDELAFSVTSRLAEVGGGLLVQALDMIEKGTAIETPQAHELATHAAKIEKDEGRVKWNEPARAIYDRFRAFHPWPGIFIDIKGEAIRLTSLNVEPEETSLLPGQIASVEDPGFTIATGDGLIRIIEAQRPGKKPVPADDLVRGWGFGVGDRFGE